MSNFPNNKRKQTIVQPLYVKVNALKELKNGVHENVIAYNLNVHVETVRKWKKREEQILELETKVEGVVPKKIKRFRKVKNEVLDNAVWQWFKERRKSGVLLDGALIRMQALTFHKTLGVTNDGFKASEGWLQKFRSRYSICSSTMTDEKKSIDAVSAENFIPFFAEYIRAENFSEHQVFHCDEIGWNFKSMPKATLTEGEKTPATKFKHKQERFTVMACSNASGLLKMRPVVIGKFAKPRSIKNVILSKTFPVYYRNQDNAWMNSKLFREWFHSEFVPKVTQFLESMKLPLKAVLLVDNGSSHPKKLVQEGNIKTSLLPPDTTALIQPMDQGILQCLKSKYRQKMMQYILNCLENGREITECIKAIDLRDVIYWIGESWQEVPLSIITEAWKPLWPDEMSEQNMKTETINSAINNDMISRFITLLQATSVYKNISHDDLQKWLYPSTVITPDEALTDEEIIQIVQNEEEEEKKNCDDKNDGDSSGNKNHDKTNLNVNNKDVISRQEVKYALKKVIRYCEGEFSPFIAEKLPHLFQLEMAFDSNES